MMCYNDDIRPALEAIRRSLRSSGSDLNCEQHEDGGGEFSFKSTFQVISGPIPDLSIFSELAAFSRSLNLEKITSFCLNHIIKNPKSLGLWSAVFIIFQQNETGRKLRANYFEKRRLWHVSSSDPISVASLLNIRRDIHFNLFLDIEVKTLQDDLGFIRNVIRLRHPHIRLILLMPNQKAILSEWQENPDIYRVLEKPVMPGAWEKCLCEVLVSSNEAVS